MPQIRLSEDERYPVIDIEVTSGGLPVEIDDEELTRIRRVLQEWEDVQERLRKLYDAAYNVAHPPKQSRDGSTAAAR